jgi:BlaI family transcriptional regulator, penicillinase repressor
MLALMAKPSAPFDDLSRRERQIMDALYRRRKATAAEIRQDLSDAPSYSAVRTFLRILEDKGFVEHVADGPRYVYQPTAPLRTARRAAARRLLETFFEGSVPQAVATLLDVSTADLSEAELDELESHIDKARKEGR